MHEQRATVQADRVIFVTAIDTGTGKTYCTGLLAAFLSRRGGRVITQKLAQTGGRGLSEDILMHRRLMGLNVQAEDRAGMTCPYVFELPASPHLAAREAGARIDTARIRAATEELAERYDTVVVEGVGGLCVPLNEDATVLDHVAACGYPVILVSSPRLGSINHTFLSLDALRARGVTVRGIVYNRCAQSHPAIAADTRQLCEARLASLDYPAVVIDLPIVAPGRTPDVDFGRLFP